ncbi:MAG TPA: hypothetical protein VFU40_07370 [Gemmatimonadales bacterium]|nr:hypothetical protein [Gemmatimonadales bacterium]
MVLTLRTVAAGLIGLTFISACPGPEAKDSEVRTYIRDELRPYLDSLAYQLCHVKAAAAPNVPGRIICPGPPDGYKPPPADGNP